MSGFRKLAISEEVLVGLFREGDHKYTVTENAVPADVVVHGIIHANGDAPGVIVLLLESEHWAEEPGLPYLTPRLQTLD